MDKQLIQRRTDRQSAPLSFSQQALWFLDQLEPNSPRYNVSRALRIRGDLNLTVLQAALDAVVDRHETLRTSFHQTNGIPIQVIGQSAKVTLNYLDLSSQTIGDHNSRLNTYINEQVRRPYNLMSDSMLRASVVRLCPDEHVLLLELPHITSDGWSMIVLCRELMTFYDSLSQHQPCPLPDLPVQYGDFAVWQREWLQGETLDREISYWSPVLAGIQPIALPLDHRRPTLPSVRNGAQIGRYPRGLTEQLTQLARSERTTLFMTLLAAFNVLLFRYTGQEDIAIGGPIANRRSVEIEGLIGFFANTLVFRTSLSGNPTFRELMARVRSVALGAYEHQDMPFEKLVEKLKPDRDPGRNPLVQVTFQLRSYPNELIQLSDLTIEPFELNTGIAKFDLSLAMTNDADGLKAEIEYNPDLFNSSTIERMSGHFQVLLEGIVADPDQRISELPLLTPAEKYQLLVEWNDTKTDYPNDKCIHELFEAQVEKSPDAIALVFEDKQLTYRELNSRANQLARHLQKLGVGPEVSVAIYLERSIEMIVGLLAILKAGGAYVPLDPDYPGERLQFMIRDAQASVLLTAGVGGEKFDESTARILSVKAHSSNPSQVDQNNLDLDLSSKNTCYVIYTSGSTGVPKGVAVSHQAVTRLVINTDYVGITPTDVIAQAANFSFDACTFEIWGALLNGARLELIDKEILLKPSALSSMIDARGITILFLTTALFNQMAEHPPQALSKLNYLLFGGETASPEKVKAFLAHRPRGRLLHLYGPTETTTFASWYWVKNIADNAVSVPIGRPIANTTCYILDTCMKPVPINVMGELYIGGPGLARGYVNHPDLTAEKFVANPFSGDADGRLYKTGDLARYLPDGNIEFLGRIDNQVKIRGYRIELGEIEAVLAQQPAIKQAVVLAREDTPGDWRLVAYTVTADGANPSAHDLRSFLQQTLPEYMLPSAFVCLDSLPLTPNGKLDRKALPAPDHSRAELEDTYVAPTTPAQEILANIWSEVLKVDKVGINDNFFQLGGHSLLATQAISRIRETFQTEVPLRALFESPTVAGLAERIREIRQQEQGVEIPPLLAAPRDNNLPLSFAQQRLWLLDQLEPDSSVYNLPSSVRIHGPLNVAALDQSLREIIRRHEALHTSFSTVEGEPVQVICLPMDIPLELIDLSVQGETDREASAQALTKEAARRPFNLAQGPLVRMRLLRLGEQDHILVLTLHHSVSDGWSMGVLYRELSVLYQTFSNNEVSPLPELTIQYADYATWQRKWLRGEELERQLSYWTRQLDGAPSVLQLPLDRPRPAVQSYRGARESIQLSKGLTQRLGRLSRSEGVTLFMTMLAAYQTLLYRYTGQEDLVVGCPIAGRNRHETEGLIGLFVNTLALRGDLSGNPTFKALLNRTREAALSAYAHQDLPFEKLVEELHPVRSLGHSPLVQVLFNMVNLELPMVDLATMIVEPFLPAEPQSKFDLTLYVRDQNEQVRLDLVYNTDLFGPAYMHFFLQQYAGLLEQVVDTPEKPIRTFSLVTPESRPLLPDPSAEIAEPSQPLATELFSRWAEQTPTRVAVSQGPRSWTYGELAQRADALARLMRSTGVEPSDVVAVHGPRSFGVMASMIATFLSGGVLLLIDDGLPAERKRFMLKETRAKKLIWVGAKPTNEAWLDAEPIAECVQVSADTGCAFDIESNGDPLNAVLPQITPEDPAYIFFTSGTTGAPKGILGVHKGLGHFLAWQREAFAITAEDRVAQLTNLSFDPVLRDVFLPLISGACLCLPETNEDFSVDGIVGWLARERVSILHAVPSLAQSWLVNPKGDVPDLRLVFSMGEPLTDVLVRQWRTVSLNHAQVVNLYGPTETTLVKCFYPVPSDPRPGVQPAGVPLPQAQALVLGDNNQLCGINELGEIVLRTPFRSLGYINAEKDNSRRFIINPFRNDGNDLIYFTGDVGRYSSDGTLEILGRTDDQVKIRGVRIEPAEVAAVLTRHPAVESCFVTARTNAQGENALAAYVVAANDRPTSAELRSYLGEQLPAVFIPASFVFLASLPLSPNGKVNRRLLPDPDWAGSEQAVAFVEPRNALEEKLAHIWAEVLRVERVGVRDDFFDLGGHSLLATKVVVRARAVLQVEIPLRMLFENPILENLAIAIAKIYTQEVDQGEIDRLIGTLESLTPEEIERLLKGG